MPSNQKIRILCYGDSNTWGFRPEDAKRHPYYVRWPGALQNLLGDKYQIIEEGLNGRTTNLNYPDRHGKNGKAYLYPCMDSHAPLHYVILSIGPNDMKAQFKRSASHICAAIEELMEIIYGKGLEQPSPGVKLILVGPPRINENVGRYADGVLEGAAKKSTELAAMLPKLAEKHGVTFVDFFDFIKPSPVDGVHLSEDAHQEMAQILFEILTHK